MSNINNLELVRKALTEVLGHEAETDNFFARDYIQTVNGEVLNYAQFASHVAHLRKSLSSVSINIFSLACAEGSVHSHHHVIVEKKDETSSQFEVFARFIVAEGKIKKCFELTRQISGCSDDYDLGART